MELRMKMVRVEYILELLEDLALKMEILEVFVFVLTCLSTNKQHTKNPYIINPDFTQQQHKFLKQQTYLTCTTIQSINQDRQ